MIDAWFGRFKVSINLNIFYINSVSLLILIIKNSFTNFNCKENFEWDRANNVIARRVWDNHVTTR